MPKCVVIEPDRLRPPGAPGRVPWSRADHLRNPRARLHQAASRQCPKNLRGTFEGLAHKDIDRLHQEPRRHLGRTDADPLVRRRRPSAAEGSAQLLGLQFARLLRADDALSRPQRARRLSRHGARLSRRRARSHPRRRLQPYRGRQREGADALVQGHRQFLLLPHDAERGALLHQRHRHREHDQHLASARAADGAGFAALLGDGDGGRRLPLRSRHHSRAASPTASTSAAASSTPSARTRCCHGSS